MNPFRLLTRASDLAIRIPIQEYSLAAVGIRSDGTIVQTTNKATRARTTKGVIPQRCWDGHAESRLCRKLDYGAKVFVARVLRNGDWAMSRPCERCMNRLRQKNVRIVYYTTGPKEYGCVVL